MAGESLPELAPTILECCAVIEREQPELRDEELSRALFASAEANLTEIFTMLRDGIPVEQTVAPRGAIALAGVMVRRDQPLASLLRAYRIGMQFLCQFWNTELNIRATDQAVLADALDQWNDFLFDYVDRVAEAVTVEYAAARERWARSAAALKAETALEILAGESIDPDAGSRRLGYELRRGHLGFVLWGHVPEDGDDLMRELETAALGIARDLGCSRPLLIPRGRAELWLWSGCEEGVSEDTLAGLAARHLAGHGIAAASGRTCADVEGFRHSHEEAIHAQQIARLAGSRIGCLTRYGTVAVESLLMADPERAAEFARRELGELAGDDDSSARLRATTAVFFECGLKLATTARRLGIHQNTVTYRIHRVEDMLGHGISERRFELEAALKVFPLVARR
ncbi:MAG: hypothetical protein QOG62_964 [Thermoleophilaceae bacterium]|nr:hypothetical protein [Thermoleophilaceae bacterium]